MAKSPHNINKMWSHEEHQRFLEALERYGSGTTGNEWYLMAQEIRTRTYQEVKIHAHNYFLQLQAAASQRRYKSSKESDELWSYEEDVLFENALASYDEIDDTKWEKITQILPNKSIFDLKKRYQQMVDDINSIEAGNDIDVIYSDLSKLPSSTLTVVHTTNSEKDTLDDLETHSSITFDCTSKDLEASFDETPIRKEKTEISETSIR